MVAILRLVIGWLGRLVMRFYQYTDRFIGGSQAIFWRNRSIIAIDSHQNYCQYTDMATIDITEKPPMICYAEDMDLRPYSAENLTKARVDKGWSQSKLAEVSGVSVSMIAKLEQQAKVSGKNPMSPTADVLKKLGKALGIYFVIVWGEIDENAQILFREKEDLGK